MKRSSIFADTISWLNETIRSEEFANIVRMNPKDFTRNRKLLIFDYMLLILRHSTKNLTLWLSEYKLETGSNKKYSKQAFSKGRLRLNPEAFLSLLRTLADRLCEKATQGIKGYRICAVDGTDLNLPNTQKLLEKFGQQTNQTEIGQVQSHCSCLYDVLNGIILDVQAGLFKTSERNQAEEHLKILSEKGLTKTIVLYDCGYPACRLIAAHHETYKIPFIMRCNKQSFIAEIRNTTEKDSWVTRQYTDDIVLKIRTINIEEKGVQWTLLTNLPESEFSVDEIKELYRMRWQIEILFRRGKKNLQIENFSGTSEAAVLQDIYATFLMANLGAAAELDAQRLQKKKKQINRVSILGRITTRFYAFFFSTRQRLKEIITDMLDEIASDVITSTNKGKNVPRKRKHGAIDFQMNYRCAR